MSNAQIGFADLLKMGDEVRADDGPGSKGWDPAGSETQRVNDAYMRALRESASELLE